MCVLQNGLLKCLDSIADVMPQVSAHTLQFLQPPQLRAQDQLTTAVGHQALNACAAVGKAFVVELGHAHGCQRAAV